MTVRDWLASRRPVAPAPLTDRIVEMLGASAALPAARAADVFLETAQVALAALLRERRFEREGALDLLAIDALMTFAYEHCAETARGAAEIDALALRGVSSVAPLATTHG